MIAAERETHINTDDDSEWVYIETAQRRYYGKLLKAAQAGRVELVKETTIDDMPYYVFRVHAKKWSPLTGVKRERNLTDEQRKALADRLRETRNNGR